MFASVFLGDMNGYKYCLCILRVRNEMTAKLKKKSKRGRILIDPISSHALYYVVTRGEK